LFTRCKIAVYFERRRATGACGVPVFRLFIYLIIMCSVDPYKVDIELVKVNITYSYKWEIKLQSKIHKLQNKKYKCELSNC